MRRVSAIAAILVLGASGCAGTSGNGSGDSPDGAARTAFDERARVVADAWRTATGTEAWRTGFVPLADLTVAPSNGFPTDAAKQAFINGWYINRAALPEAAVGPGTIEYPGGGRQSVPLVSGRAAFAEIDKGAPPCPGDPRLPGPGTDGGGGPSPVPTGPDGPVSTSAPQTCSTLTVTTVTLGSATLKTSRGDATVPAWLFTIAGLSQPIARVAVAPGTIGAIPTASLPPAERTPGLVTSQDLVKVDGATIHYTLGVGACDTGITPLVYESAEAVVVGGSVIQATGICIDLLKIEPVTVTLAGPLGARPVVDSATGRLLILATR